jgi:hypothetical protein
MKPDKKTRLIKFLDRRAFDPVLKVSWQDLKDEAEQKKLKHVQQITEAEKNRYHTQYESADEVKRAFFDDINSSVENQTETELKELRLPRLVNLKDEFVGLCEKLHI